MPDFVLRPPTGPYHSLNPGTKLVIAFAQAAIAFGVRGWTGPLVVLAMVIATAAVARIGRSMVPFALAVIPLVASILLINTFLFPGATDVIVRIGPLSPTWTGLEAALQATLRVAAFALSVAVFALTTPTDDLLADLERRGLGRRGVFVIGAAIGMIPRMAERAAEITDSQRARGLDTEGSPVRRVRGRGAPCRAADHQRPVRSRGANDGTRGPGVLRAGPANHASAAARLDRPADRPLDRGPGVDRHRRRVPGRLPAAALRSRCR